MCVHRSFTVDVTIGISIHNSIALGVDDDPAATCNMFITNTSHLLNPHALGCDRIDASDPNIRSTLRYMDGISFHHPRSILDLTNDENTPNVIDSTSKGIGRSDGIFINVSGKLDCPFGLQGIGVYFSNKGLETARGWDDNVLIDASIHIAPSRSDDEKCIFIERIVTDVGDDIQRLRSKTLSGSTRSVPIRIVQGSSVWIQDGHESIRVRACHRSIGFPLGSRRTHHDQTDIGLVDHSTDMDRG